MQRVLGEPFVKDHLLNISSGMDDETRSRIEIEDLDVPLYCLRRAASNCRGIGALDEKIAVNERLARRLHGTGAIRLLIHGCDALRPRIGILKRVQSFGELGEHSMAPSDADRWRRGDFTS